MKRESFAANQWDETAGTEHAQRNTLTRAEDKHEFLLVAVAHGHHHAPSDSQLTDQRWRQVGRRCGHHDGVIRAALGTTESFGGVLHDDIPVTQVVQGIPRPFGQAPNQLEGDDSTVWRHLGQYGGLVAGSGADLQHPVRWLETERFGDPGDDVGLGDGLALADGQGYIQERVGALADGHEQLPHDYLWRTRL